jgi:hypothetical protein
MNKTKIAVLSLFAALALSASAFGQTALTATKLAAAVTTSANIVRVSSATGILAGNLLFIEDGTGGGSGAGSSEAMLVESISGTVATVVRGYYGSIANAHISGALVITGTPNQFYAVEPSGACTATSQPVTPYINVKSGNQWLCSTVTGSWVPGFFNTAAPAGVTTAVASVAGATNPSGPLFHVTGALAITAWGSSTTVGLAAGGGSATDVLGANFCIIPDGAFTTTATNNIALASTAVVNKLLCFTFDQTNKKYVPSY